MALSALTKNRPYMLTMLGLALMAQSVVWEYVRVAPDYRFVIEPWSIRGFTTAQGRVIAVAAILLMIATTLVVRGKIKETTAHSIGFVGAVVLVPVAAAIITNANSVVLGGMGVALVSLLGAVVITVLVGRFALPEGLRGASRAGLRIGLFFITLLVLAIFVLGPLFGSREVPTWLVLTMVFGLIGVLAITRQPERLAARRMLINGVVALWLMTVTMAASLRWDLLHQQFANLGVNAELGDIGITSGILMCWLGGLLAFAGAVSLWAKRRDPISAQDRARHQQEAARESQVQLAESSV